MIIFCIDIGICNIGWCVLEKQTSETQPIAIVDNIKFIDGGLDWLFETASRKSCRMIAEKFTQWIYTGPLQRFPDATIVCEEQVNRAAKNKMMSMILLSHCWQKQFHFVGSNTKFSGMPLELFPPTVTKQDIVHDTYASRKHASVLLAKHICGSRELLKPALAVFETMKKQDDFADAINEGIYFLQKQHTNHKPKKTKNPKNTTATAAPKRKRKTEDSTATAAPKRKRKTEDLTSTAAPKRKRKTETSN